MAEDWRDDLAAEERCTNCQLALPRHRDNQRRVDGKVYCVLCFDMRDSISGNEFMQRQQAEFEEKRKRIAGLKPGGEYMA